MCVGNLSRYERQLLLSEDIDAIDYHTIKSECEAKLAKTTTNTTTTIGVDKLIDKAISTLSHMDIIYNEASVSRKREIISSIYPEKLNFDRMQYRTPRVNETARLIFQINNELDPIKTGKAMIFHAFPVQ